MKLSGHQTNAVYRGYDIIDKQDLRESMAKVQEHLAKQQEGAKVGRMKAPQQLRLGKLVYGEGFGLEIKGALGL